jgi:hypothetical protein
VINCLLSHAQKVVVQKCIIDLNRMITRVKRFKKKLDNACKKNGTWTKKTKEVKFVTPP